MARPVRHTTSAVKKSLKDLLHEEADQFEFHALVKVLERLNPQAIPLGEGAHPDKEAIRIKTKIGFDFPSTDIFSLDPTDTAQMEMVTNFLNIAGIQGPLPTPYMQMLVDRDRQKDTAFHSFLDIFNHRIISIFHRIRKKYWIGVSADPPETTMMGRILKCLIGLGMLPKEDSRLKVLDRSLLYYAGLIWCIPHSRIAVERILTHYFNVPIKMEPFQGAWVKVPKDQQTVIGEGGKFNRLGKDCILGDRFWEQQASIKIHIGPIGIKEYINFLKPGKAYRALTILMAYLCGKDQDFTVNLILKKEEVPTVKLGQGMALHWTSWINRKGTTWDEDDQQNTMNKKSFKIL